MQPQPLEDNLILLFAYCISQNWSEMHKWASYIKASYPPDQLKIHLERIAPGLIERAKNLMDSAIEKGQNKS